MKNRSRSEIYRSILETANADEGTNKTKLMYKSYLSFNQLKEYLATLQENGLIEYEVGMRRYRITDRGIRVLQLQNKMEEITLLTSSILKNS
jgi:predicted transcriptional regulator